jgi:hypothetical protein
MNLEFDLSKTGKSSFQATKKEGKAAKVGNDNFYPGKLVVRVPAVSTKKGFGTNFVMSAGVIKALNVVEGEDTYVGILQHTDGKVYLINFNGTMDVDTLKKELKYAKITKKGTFSSKYMAEALAKAGFPADATQDVEVSAVSAGNVKGAVAFGNILATNNVVEEDDQDSVEDTDETDNAGPEIENVESEEVEDAIVEGETTDSEAEFTW